MNKEKICISENQFIEIKTLLELLEYLSNEDNFMQYKSEFYSEFEDEYFINSFSFFVCCIIDILCGKIADSKYFFNNERDWNLCRGHDFPVHYTIFCNNSLQGRLCYFLYNFSYNKLLKSTNLSDFFEYMKELLIKIQDFKDFFSRKKIQASKYLLFIDILQLIKTQYIPGHFPKDLPFVISHIFRNYNEFLEFMKKDDGEWISSLGFFMGIFYTFKYLLDQDVFKNNFVKIILEELPFKDFSLERSGLFGQKKYSFYSDKLNDFTANFIYNFVTEYGPMQIYELISLEIAEYFNKLDRLHLFFDIKKFSLIEKNRLKFKDSKVNIGAIEFLKSLQFFDEKYILPKLVDYNHIISISTEDGIIRCSLFDLISRGMLNRRIKDDKLELVVLQNLSKELEQTFLQDKLIKEIKLGDKFHFMNNIEHVPLDLSAFDVVIGEQKPTSDKSIPIYCGYFFNIYASSIASNHSYSIGSFLYGGNDDGVSASETQNFDLLVDFIQNNQDEIDLKTFVVKNDYLYNLFINTRNNMIIPFQSPSPFELFFSSPEEISDALLLDQFIETFTEFKESFQSKKTTNKRKKESLENLASKLFEMLPGIEIIGKDILTPERAEEIDIIVRSKPEHSKFIDLFEILGPNFLVECKNISAKVSSKQVAEFGKKISSCTFRTGIIISRKGLSGSSIDKAARRQVRDWALRGIVILSLDLEDLELVAKGKNPVYIIRKAYSNFFFPGLS